MWILILGSTLPLHQRGYLQTTEFVNWRIFVIHTFSRLTANVYVLPCIEI